jgi:hypothetical protein
MTDGFYTWILWISELKVPVNGKVLRQAYGRESFNMLIIYEK